MNYAEAVNLLYDITIKIKKNGIKKTRINQFYTHPLNTKYRQTGLSDAKPHAVYRLPQRSSSTLTAITLM